MKMRGLLKYSTMIEWFDTINPTENTIRTYLNALQSLYFASCSNELYSTNCCGAGADA